MVARRDTSVNISANTEFSLQTLYKSVTHEILDFCDTACYNLNMTTKEDIKMTAQEIAKEILKASSLVIGDINRRDLMELTAEAECVNRQRYFRLRVNPEGFDTGLGAVELHVSESIRNPDEWDVEVSWSSIGTVPVVDARNFANCVQSVSMAASLVQERINPGADSAGERHTTFDRNGNQVKVSIPE